MPRNYLKILICQDKKFKNCCRNDLKNEGKHFKAGREDTFDLGHSTGDCQKFKVIKKILLILNVPQSKTKSRRLKPHKYLLIFAPELCCTAKAMLQLCLFIEILKSFVTFLYLKLFLITLSYSTLRYTTSLNLGLTLLILIQLTRSHGMANSSKFDFLINQRITVVQKTITRFQTQSNLHQLVNQKYSWFKKLIKFWFTFLLSSMITWQQQKVRSAFYFLRSNHDSRAIGPEYEYNIFSQSLTKSVTINSLT